MHKCTLIISHLHSTSFFRAFSLRPSPHILDSGDFVHFFIFNLHVKQWVLSWCFHISALTDHSPALSSLMSHIFYENSPDKLLFSPFHATFSIFMTYTYTHATYVGI